MFDRQTGRLPFPSTVGDPAPRQPCFSGKTTASPARGSSDLWQHTPLLPVIQPYGQDGFHRHCPDTQKTSGFLYTKRRTHRHKHLAVFANSMQSPHLQAGIFPDSQPSGPKPFRIRETVATRCIPAIDNTLFLRAVMNTLYITTPRNETGLFQSFQTRAGQTETGIRFTSRHAGRVFHPARTIRTIQPDRNGKPVSIRANVRKNSAPGLFSTTHIIHFPGRIGHRAIHAPDLLPALTQTPE